MPDGPEQEARDRRLDAKPGDDITNPDKWSDPSWQKYAWGTDVMKVALNHVFTLQPLSIGNVHRRALFTKPRPTFPFVQGPPGNHSTQVELRYGPLISGVSLPADNDSRHYHSLSLGATATRDSARKTIRGFPSPIRSWGLHPLSKRAPTLKTVGVLATLCACLYTQSR